MELITDKLDISWYKPPDELDSKKTAKKLFQDLDSLLMPNTTGKHLNLFVEAPNLLSACINYNVMHNWKKYQHVLQQGYTELVKSAFKNDFRKAKNELALLRQNAPEDFLKLEMESKKDETTWTSTDPWLLRELSARIKDSYDPELIISPAHGSIRPAILLSILMNTDTYFIRLSRYKQFDFEPKVGIHDVEFLKQVGDKKVLCYDEDTASGRTLETFSSYLKKHAKNLKTATTRRFYLTAHNPDFFAESFY